MEALSREKGNYVETVNAYAFYQVQMKLNMNIVKTRFVIQNHWSRNLIRNTCTKKRLNRSKILLKEKVDS